MSFKALCVQTRFRDGGGAQLVEWGSREGADLSKAAKLEAKKDTAFIMFPFFSILNKKNDCVCVTWIFSTELWSLTALFSQPSNRTHIPGGLPHCQAPQSVGYAEADQLLSSLLLAVVLILGNDPLKHKSKPSSTPKMIFISSSS